MLGGTKPQQGTSSEHDADHVDERGNASTCAFENPRLGVGDGQTLTAMFFGPVDASPTMLYQEALPGFAVFEQLVREDCPIVTRCEGRVLFQPCRRGMTKVVEVSGFGHRQKLVARP